MDKKERYLTKTISFGKEDNLARILIEAYLKKYPDTDLSNFIQKLIITFMSKKPEFAKLYKELMVRRYKEVKREAAYKIQEKADLEETLKELKVDKDDL